MKIEKIDIDDASYPIKLRAIKNPPESLYVLGNKNILNNAGIAIVGSRDCTKEGIQSARMFSANIAKEGFTVISGMAKGIDAAAHSGALEVGGKTIAVLGCGPDVIYPLQNRYIYEKILEMGGTIVSEYPSMTGTKSERFRKRNRIVSGLSLGVLVIEAEYRSGTTITARYAKEQGKDVYCIPNSITNNKGIGTNMLIQKGAKLILNPKQIIENYIEKSTRQISIKELEEKSKIDLYDLHEIKQEYREIYKLLLQGNSINEIKAKTNMNLQELYQKLFMMELEGMIENKHGRYTVNKK